MSEQHRPFEMEIGRRMSKRSAEMLSARLLPPPMRDLDVEVWGPETRYVLLGMVRQGVARGEIAMVGEWRPVAGWPGYYSVEVRRLRRPAPAWKRWAIGVGSVFSLMAGLLTAGAVLIPTWVAILILLCGIGTLVGSVVVKVASGRTINITQNVNVRK